MTKLKTYAITISYDDPSFNTMIVSAKDREEAESIVHKMTNKCTNVEIIQVFDVKNAPDLQSFLNSNRPQGDLN